MEKGVWRPDHRPAEETKHCFGTGRCKLQKFRLARLSVFVYERIFDMPEMARLLLVFHFRIGNGRITYRTPVNDSAALINPSFFVHLTEHFRDRYNALWQPGTDHASIATEVRIIETLKDEGIQKEDLGRDGFLKRAWEWKEEYGGLCGVPVEGN